LKIDPNIVDKFTSTCPQLPGIYQIFGEKGKVLYIGKAKNLRERIKNYQNISTHSPRITAMISQIRHIEIIITNDEKEALLLEADLIKRHKPKYNVLLKDNKSFPYICLDETSGCTRLFKCRKSVLEGRSYYGPFTSVKKLNEAIFLLQKMFLLRSCTDMNFKSRTRPCILYQINRCAAPCMKKISETDYKELVAQTKDFLSGKSNVLQRQLTSKMKAASDVQDYEKAALCRDRIKTLAFVQAQNQIADFEKLYNVDIICIKTGQNFIAIQIFLIRSGCNFGNKIYYLHDIPNGFQESNLILNGEGYIEGRETDEILVNFLQEFYHNNTLPRELWLNQNCCDAALLEQLFINLYGQKVKVFFPTRGKKLRLIKTIEMNLENNLKLKAASQTKHMLGFDALKQYFKLPKLDHIEVYDNSHTAGFEAGGVMISCGRDGFIKSNYRKYSVNTDQPTQDDYLILKEILSRRFRSKMHMPDMIVIDGGKGQLSVAQKTIATIGIQSPLIISMAKGKKRNSGNEIIYTSENKGIYLNKNDAMKQYLQVLRDEAHRFAITSHRSKRDKSTFKGAPTNY